MATIAVDGMNEEAFRRSIESRLRQGAAGKAVQKLRALLEPYAGIGRILPERFLTVQAADLTLNGWEGLGEAIARHDRPGWPITALSIAFGWPGEELPQPDAQGRLSPLIETGYFSDEAYPFSQSRRDDLLDGYSYHGCTWADESVATDNCLSLEGIDDLHGALAALEVDLLACEEPDEEGIRAGSLGACLLSALLFQAVGQRIERDGLPRPLCVLAGSNGIYPYFDAPVAGIPEEVLKAAEAAEEEFDGAVQGVPGPRYSSLLVTGIPRARKRAVLVLEESPEEAAARNANLRGLDQAGAAPEPVPDAVPYTDPLASNLAEAGIIPMPNGPLMTKKPTGQSWDFRELLGPRVEPGPADGPAAVEPDQPGPDLPPASAVEPAAHAPPVEPDPVRPAPALFPPATLPAEPGFALLETSHPDPFQPLIAPLEPVAAPAPLAVAVPEPDPPAVAKAPEGPAWPFGIGWLEDFEEPGHEDPGLPASAATGRPGLWSRLRAWLRF